jgi:hypothetical protein
MISAGSIYVQRCRKSGHPGQGCCARNVQRGGSGRTHGKIAPGVGLYRHACTFEPLWDSQDTLALLQYPVQQRIQLRRFFATVNETRRLSSTGRQDRHPFAKH